MEKVGGGQISSKKFSDSIKNIFTNHISQGSGDNHNL